MKRLLILTTMLLSWSAAHGQSIVLKPGEILRGNFVQERHMSGFSKPVITEGNFSLLPGKGLYWQAERPFPVTTAVTAQGIVQSVAGTETARLTASRLPFLPRLYAMLSGALAGDLSALQNEFFIVEEQIGKRRRITLTPRLPDGPTAAVIQSLQVDVDRFVDSVEIRKPGGDWDRLIFKGQTLSAGQPNEKESAALEASR